MYAVLSSVSSLFRYVVIDWLCLFLALFLDVVRSLCLSLCMYALSSFVRAVVLYVCMSFFIGYVACLYLVRLFGIYVVISFFHYLCMSVVM